MDNTLNTFAKGMIKDVAETLRPEDSYEDAQDMKLNAGNSASEYIISNVKGNKLSFTVPDVPQICKVKAIGDDYIENQIYTPHITVNSTNIFATENVEANTLNAFFDQLEEILKTNTAFSSLNLNVHRIGTTIRVWSNTDQITLNTALWISNSTDIEFTVQAPQTSQQIIGWDNIGDEIYLLTTNDSSSTGGYGTFWKVTYNEVTLDPTIELKYSEFLNFTTQNLIANPGGIETILENSQISRIYWTDRLNPLRTINIADDNVMCFDPEDLDLRLSTSMKKPVLKSVQNGGELLTGVYQVAYNLRNADGATTPYSHTSNNFDIFVANLDAYALCEGNDSGILTGKSFTIEIQDIDTNYEFVDLVILRKDNANATAVIGKITDLPITSSTFTYTHSGNEPQAIITEADFNRIRIFFEKCQTIAQKDNILFAANTVERLFDVDFDARAYRFARSTNCKLADESGTQITYTPNQLLSSFAIPEDEDAINPDQSVFKFQSDGITLGGEGPHISYKFTQQSRVTDAVIGNGPPVIGWSYPFQLPYNVPNDQFPFLNDTYDYYGGGPFPDFKSPNTKHNFRGYRRGETYRFSWVPVKDGVEGYAKWIADIKMPEIFDHPNNEDQIFRPLEYNNDLSAWVANSLGVEFSIDIPQSIADQIDGFRIKRVKLEPEDRTIVAQGIVHLSSLESAQISPTARYHPIGHWDSNGLPTYGLNSSSTANTWLGTTQYDFYTNYLQNQIDPENSAPGNENSNLGNHGIVSFHSPDFLFGESPNFVPGDVLKIVGGLVEAGGTYGSVESVNSGSGPIWEREVHVPGYQFNAWKLYNYAPVNWHISPEPNNQFVDDIYKTIGGAVQCPYDGDITVDGTQYRNTTKYDGSYNDNPLSIGSDTTVVKLATRGFPKIETASTAGAGMPFSSSRIRHPLGVNYIGTGNATDAPDKFLCNYVRKRENQYGGEGYSARSKNVYINTGCDIQLNGQTTFNNVKVFGGDTFVNVFDAFKLHRNFAIVSPTDQRNPTTAVGLYYPCESFVNTYLREGYHLNGRFNPAGGLSGGDDQNGTPDPDNYPLDYGEDFKYNYLFSEEMDTQRSFPKPIGFEEISEHPHRIWASEIKTHGERVDSWRQFTNETYIDIQGDLGEIRQLVNRDNTLLAWQKRGFGIASVNERSILNDQSGTGIILGKSGILPRFDYVSQYVGSWHQFSFAVSPMGVLFFDGKDGGLYLYSPQGLRDVSAGKVNSWLHENTRGNVLLYDAPIGSNPITGYAGMSSTYDYVNKEFLITFFDRDPYTESGSFNLIGDSFTIAYSDTSDVFTSFRSFKPIMYINDNKNIFTPKPFSSPSEVYIHEEGDYGVFYDNSPTTSSITTVVNKEPFITKIFDNIRWFSEVFLPNGTEVSDETVSSIETFNTYQTTGVRTQFRRLMREWKHAIQYQLNTKNRIRSHYVRQKFEFLNNNDKEFRLHYIMNLFRKIMK
jgi:hypothetical protein